jgi:hypothetical protein
MMSALVEHLAAGRITCSECGATTLIDRDTVAVMAVIDRFWDAHHNCGRIYIDLENGEPSHAIPEPRHDPANPSTRRQV